MYNSGSHLKELHLEHLVKDTTRPKQKPRTKLALLEIHWYYTEMKVCFLKDYPI